MGNTCCFIGHRTINETDALRAKLTETIEELITREQVDTFLFGGKGVFDRLCHALVTELKGKYPHIKRIYVRAEFPFIRDDYRAYLLQSYEDTDFPQRIMGAGRAAYVERNYEMIHRSQYCVVYYNGQAVPTTRKSGTKIALDYAIKKGKVMVTFP
ncbi:MAG: DUF1273 domain-containing protein [Ruminococcaceae bacterium]|nr:DUF1273 domain-containing protein [Oscillospiraceae bacterium]